MWITSVYIRLSDDYESCKADEKGVYMFLGTTCWPVYFLIMSSRWATNKVKEMCEDEDGDKDES